MQLKTKLKGTNMIQIAYKFNVFEIKSHSYLNFSNSWFYLYVGLLTLLYNSRLIVSYLQFYAYFQFTLRPADTINWGLVFCHIFY